MVPGADTATVAAVEFLTVSCVVVVDGTLMVGASLKTLKTMSWCITSKSHVSTEPLSWMWTTLSWTWPLDTENQDTTLSKWLPDNPCLKQPSPQPLRRQFQSHTSNFFSLTVSLKACLGSYRCIPTLYSWEKPILNGRLNEKNGRRHRTHVLRVMSQPRWPLH